MTSGSRLENDPVVFGERLAGSSAFKMLFRDGMALVERTAAYLDGEGRDAARLLPRAAALSYASESMRLTTRLMQIASWLLLQRAVNEGEMTQAEASSDKHRARIAMQGAPVTAASDGLPEALVALIDESIALQQRMVRLDASINSAPNLVPFGQGATPLEAQMAALRDAFSR